MIKQKEIIRLAEKYGIPKSTIDTDWVLGHFLNAFFDNELNKENFVFKGGTCLRKCYFENYRFSEDLDFTLLNPDIIIEKIFFKRIINKATEISGIQFYLQ